MPKIRRSKLREERIEDDRLDVIQLMRLYQHKFSGWEGRPRSTLLEHRTDLDAIRDCDGELVEALMRRHIRKACRKFEQE